LNTTANKAVFTMTGVAGNIAGTFLTSEPVKGSATGVLYAASLFATGSKQLSETDVLTIGVVIAGA
jgi:hypothetical protein